MEENMKKFYLQLLVVLSVLVSGITTAYGHCEIPCGIYNDRMRIKMIMEHIDTIEKSMNQIIELEKADHSHANQLVRWVVNKDDHAQKIQDIVARYFMTQRISPGTEKYSEKLAALHKMLIYAMKCKQTTDSKNVEKLREQVKIFEALYFKPETSDKKE